jgi:hypothetical protein
VVRNNLYLYFVRKKIPELAKSLHIIEVLDIDTFDNPAFVPSGTLEAQQPMIDVDISSVSDSINRSNELSIFETKGMVVSRRRSIVERLVIFLLVGMNPYDLVVKKRNNWLALPDLVLYCRRGD